MKVTTRSSASGRPTAAPVSTCCACRTPRRSRTGCTSTSEPTTSRPPTSWHVCSLSEHDASTSANRPEPAGRFTGTIAVGQANVNGTADLTNTTPLHQLPGAAYNYDAAHRLTHIQAAASTTYGYNGDGLRTSSTTGQATQQYAWNLTSNLPLMLTDGTIDYFYDDSGAPIEQIAADGTTLYYQHDQYGSTRLLTDAAGAVVATYTYSAHGRVTSRTGIADSPLRWNGLYQDATGLYYLRARHYDPATTQFMTVDPRLALTGRVPDPV